MEIGKTLKDQREAKNLTLADVENETKIRARYLAALEEENYAEIPGEVYVIGFLRNYARYLGLDGDALVNSYRSQEGVAEPDQDNLMTQAGDPAEEQALPSRAAVTLGGKRLLYALVGLAVVALLIILFTSLKGGTRNAEEVRRQPVVKHSTRVARQKAESLSLELKAREKCWVQVKTDGQVGFSGMLEKGMKKSFKAQKSMTLLLGNAGGVDVTCNGKKLPPLGRSGEVVTKEFRLSS